MNSDLQNKIEKQKVVQRILHTSSPQAWHVCQHPKPITALAENTVTTTYRLFRPARRAGLVMNWDFG